MEGSKVYIPDPTLAWVPGTLMSVDEVARVAQVKPEEGEVRQVDLKSPEFKPMDYSIPLQNVDVPEKGVDDMTTLNYLHEPAILYNLRRRFQACCPYTYTGDICIAVNPYQWLDHLYTVEVRDQYLYYPRAELLPHVYAISASAYRGIATDGMNQSILVSGESGAGKTETVKILMSHLATSSEEEMNHLAGAGAGGEDQQQQQNTIEKVLQSNPLLESFGNAKTVRNDNSSRFGKFTQLEFRAFRRHHSTGPAPCLLLGSRCVTYLLEKSRVVHHSEGERNYHIFYQLLAAPEEVKSHHGLGGKTLKDFFYMTGDHGGSDTTVIEGKSDAERYHSTCKALGLVGVLPGDGVPQGQSELFRALAGILYLGQIEIVAHEVDNEEGSKVTNEPALVDAAKWLGCEPTGLATAMCRRTVKTRNETYSVAMNANQATDARDALAKELYSRFFLWLVDKINGSTAPSMQGRGDSYSHSTIGLLDIFGFESFTVNRFEQMCINYCNEKLQQKFTLDTFKTVQNEYEDEGISWNFVEFKDNAPVLDLIEGRVGIITVLNEECMLAKGSDPTFTSKLTTIHAEHPHLIKERLSKVEFSIVHYAGTVKYTATGFVNRNKDTLPDDLGKAMASSTNALVKRVFLVPEMDAEDEPPTGVSKGPTKRKKGALVGETVTTKFKTQLADLMDTITATRVQYIRCIKPNPIKSKTVMDHLQVVEQLRCAGVIEAIRISRAAYPNRTRHTEFLSRFLILLSTQQIATLPEIPHGKAGGAAGHPNPSPGGLHRLQAEVCRKVLEYLVKEDLTKRKGGKLAYEVGKTRVYFRSGVLEDLEEQRLRSIGKKVTTIQRYFRGYLMQQNYRRIRVATILLQSLARARRQIKRFEEDRRRVIVAQSQWRARQARQYVHEKRIQTRSTAIQAAVRRFLCSRDYKQKRDGAIRVQSLARMWRARTAYVAALAEAKEQAKLENQLEMLKRRLEEESLARQKAEQQLSTQQQQGTAAVPSGVAPSTGGGGGGVVVSGGTGASANGLMEQQGAMLEYLKKKVVKYRDQFIAVQRENEGLKKDVETLRAENQRVKDAHAAAGMSFTALNQHSSQLQRIYKKLMTEHQERLDEIGKLNAQLARYQEELNMKQDLYTMEVQVNRKQDRTMSQMIDLVCKRVGDIDPELIEEMVELHNTCTAALRLSESGGNTIARTHSGGRSHHLANGGASHRSPHSTASSSGSGLAEGENAVKRVSKSLLSGISKFGAFVTGGDL